MTSYIGVKCPVCHKRFGSTDDIVVCPVCGAPHHRDCYKENEECAFASDHLNGKEWHPPIENNDSGTSCPVRYCSRCASPNPAEGIYCQVCSAPLHLVQKNEHQNAANAPSHREADGWGFPGFAFPDSISLIYGGLSPDGTIDGESVRDLQAYIGPNSAYYLPRFERFSKKGNTFSTNFAAFFFSFFYFFYRKMYWIGTLLLTLMLVSMIPNVLYAIEVMPRVLYEIGLSPTASINTAVADHYFFLSNLSRTINFFISLVVSLCANRLYYAKVMRSVAKIRTSAPAHVDDIERRKQLSRIGGCSKTTVIVVAVLLACAHLVVSAWIAFYLNVPLG